MRVNREIRAPRVRVIGQNGEQVGVVPLQEAMRMAESANLDLVEIVPNSNPPVCKVIDYGKYRYDQTKKEKESKKAQHQVKVKEVKVKPNIGQHDLNTKIRHAREFIEGGNKVKITCQFRGREMAHPEFGEKVINQICQELSDIAQREAPPKMFGRMMNVVISPAAAKKGRK
ncbi:MAG: translation initiation factor IF-3 [Chlamydiia bacterium]|nr:translation initiation factor IF-3 [Chlamydiia bacterium]